MSFKDRAAFCITFIFKLVKTKSCFELFCFALMFVVFDLSTQLFASFDAYIDSKIFGG